MKSILTVIGTRPEAIKLAPVLRAISKNKHFESRVCVTRQHTDLLDPFLLSLGIIANYHFENDKNKVSLHQKAAHILHQFDSVLTEFKPDVIVVQGDTTTAFIAALAAFYSCIPVAHVEAGLRTGDLYSPWPEEAHRCLISKLATYFFAPTLQAQNILLAEGIAAEKIWVVGNTSIDAIKLARQSTKLNTGSEWRKIVVTVHRRENHGQPLEDICQALCMIVEQFSDVRIQFLLHPNPAIQQPVIDRLSGMPHIDLIEPMDHSSFVQLLDECFFVITDSGGIQEEAPFMGKPLVIIRDTTERPEGVRMGTARLVGTQASTIIACCQELLENREIMASMSKVHFPYGDGHAAEKIVNILEKELQVVSA